MPALFSAGRTITCGLSCWLLVLLQALSLQCEGAPQTRLAPLWPMLRFDANHTGRTTARGPSSSSVKVLWKYQGGDNFISSPAIGGDGTVFVCNNDGNLYSFDGQTGAVKFKVKDAIWDSSSPSLSADGSQVVVNDYMCGVIAFNTTTGAELWQWTAAACAGQRPGDGGPLEASTTIGGDGTIYTRILSGLYAIFPNNGTTRWNVSLGYVNPSGPTPAISRGGMLFYPDGQSGSVLAYKAATGELLWTQSVAIKSYYLASPALNYVHGSLVVGGGGLVASLATDTGELRWSVGTNSPTASFTNVAIAADGTVIAAMPNALVALDGASGAQKWSYGPVGTGQPAPVIDGNGVVYCGVFFPQALYASVIALDGTTGHLLWIFNVTTNQQFATPTIGAAGTLYVGANDHYLYALVDGR
jgi:outer membrane protein assembly factor BamB